MNLVREEDYIEAYEETGLKPTGSDILRYGKDEKLYGCGIGAIIAFRDPDVIEKVINDPEEGYAWWKRHTNCNKILSAAFGFDAGWDNSSRKTEGEDQDFFDEAYKAGCYMRKKALG